MREDIEKLIGYMEAHAGRLGKDITNAASKKEENMVEFYDGAKGATEMFLRLLKEIYEKNA